MFYAGGHQVASSDVPDLYINVCREITGDVAPGKHCPEGSSSCTNGKDTGHIVGFSKLEMVNDYTIHLSYANATSGCSTNITFVCPKAVSEIVSVDEFCFNMGTFDLRIYLLD